MFPRRSSSLLLAFMVLIITMAPVLVASTSTAPPEANRTLVEEVTGWLRVYSDGSVERLTPPGAEAFTAIVPPYAKPRGGVTVHDIHTSRGVEVRLYLPETAAGPAPLRHYRGRPVLLHFHGGGFCISRPSWALYHNFYAALAAELNVAGVVSVFLPLSPEHRLPAAIDTGHAALLWLRDVARGENGNGTTAHSDDPAVGRLRTAADFSRVFLIGDSSGGNLVHLVAARATEDGAGVLHPVRLAGGVLLHPGFARKEKSQSELRNPPSLFLTQEMVDKLLPLGLPLGATKDSPYTSPSLAANAVACLDMPPLLLMVAEKDLLRDTQLEYGVAMARAGKAVETVVSRGAVAHIFFLNFIAVKSNPLTAERTRELIGAVKDFIEAH